MKIEFSSIGIHLIPENYQDGLSIAFFYLETIQNTNEFPCNIELEGKKDNVSGSLEGILNLEDSTNELEKMKDIAEYVTELFIGNHEI